MFSHGKLASALLSTFLSAALVAAPYRIPSIDSSKVLFPQTAEAQDSDEGSESGNSDPGEESSSGNSGKTDADTEGQPLTEDDEQEQEQELDAGSDELTDPVTDDDAASGDAGLEVLHPNGMREEIRNGRYEMIDAQGRIIVTRPATEADLARLRAMIN